MTARAAASVASPDAAPPDYAVPALDKALDVLELVADQAGGLTQSEIADAVGRSVGQIFRVLTTLERRGWLARVDGRYSLTTAMFDLAHRHPPLRGLIAAAMAPLRELSDAVGQSANLTVLDADRVRVIAQVESPADFGWRVRVGAVFPLASATGRALIGDAPTGSDDALHPGIVDIVAPVRDYRGATIAAVTVLYVASTRGALPPVDVEVAARSCAAAISASISGLAQGAAG